MRKHFVFLATCFTATCRRRACFHKLLGSATLPVLCALQSGRLIHVVGVIRLLSVNSFCVLMLSPRGSRILTQVCCNCTQQRLVFLGPKMGSPKGRKLIPHAMAPDCPSHVVRASFLLPAWGLLWVRRGIRHAC